MCMEDVRLGRERHSRVTLVPCVIGNNVLAPSDPSRVTIIITTVDGSVCWISDKVMTATGTGLRVAPNNTNLADFRIEDHGDFVTNAINVWVDAAVTVSILETSLSKK